ncbi:fido domain-containing protein [Xylariaceae sp. FL0255]|nr:fido domain-containing protein [Xylariaceae sp. FL0255]
MDETSQTSIMEGTLGHGVDGPRKIFPRDELFSTWLDLAETKTDSIIYGSNLIEDAGAGPDYTSMLCSRVLYASEPVDANAIVSKDREYLWIQDDLARRGKQIDLDDAKRIRREIIHHAEAFVWAVQNIVLSGKPWTEDAVKTIHEILYRDLAHDEVKPGEYRGVDHPVAATHINPHTGKRSITRFIHPRAVPDYMAQWVKAMNDELAELEDGSKSFILSEFVAKHYHHFINIHPFGDGNGRVSRIILNCLMLKLSGTLTPLGTTLEEKEAFLQVAVRGSKKYHEEDGEVPLELQEGHLEMARLLKTKAERLARQERALTLDGTEGAQLIYLPPDLGPIPILRPGLCHPNCAEGGGSWGRTET